MSSVFVVQHSYEQDDDCQCEETKFIGVYSCITEATAAVERLRTQPGFSSRPEAFSIDEYPLNVDHWSEGYVTESDGIFAPVSASGRPPSPLRVIFIDVDDTLVRSVGTKRIPIPAALAAVKRLHQTGVQLFLWSSGGAEYARRSAVELGIESYFENFLPKPHTYIDDQPVHEWRFCKHVLPGNAEDA